MNSKSAPSSSSKIQNKKAESPCHDDKKVKKGGASSSIELKANVEKSVETALEILNYFEKSLLEGGFGQGIDAYQKLSQTLVMQRLWSCDLKGDPLRSHFAQLSAQANNIYTLLEPYTAVMKTLAVIELTDDSSKGSSGRQSELAESQSQELKGPEAELYQALQKQSRPISSVSLRRITGLDRLSIRSGALELARRGLLTESSRGGRIYYELVKSHG